MDDLLADFLTETNENLAELDVALLTLERTPDDAATLGLIFRMVHTIKGTCGFLGLPRLERVAHAGENVLGQLRDGKLSASPDIVSQILTALDRIKEILSSLSRSGAEPPGDDAILIAELNATASGQPPARAEKPVAAAAPTPPAPTPPAPTAPAEVQAPSAVAEKPAARQQAAAPTPAPDPEVSHPAPAAQAASAAATLENSRRGRRRGSERARPRQARPTPRKPSGSPSMSSKT